MKLNPKATKVMRISLKAADILFYGASRGGF